MREEKYTLQMLISDAKAKFDWDIDPITLSAQFLRVKEITGFPRMLRSLKRPEMEEFFLKQAQILKKEIFK